jgi:hypothetical protein
LRSFDVYVEPFFLIFYFFFLLLMKSILLSHLLFIQLVENKLFFYSFLSLLQRCFHNYKQTEEKRFYALYSTPINRNISVINSTIVIEDSSKERSYKQHLTVQHLFEIPISHYDIEIKWVLHHHHNHHHIVNLFLDKKIVLIFLFDW